jgi:integrator complex subunit 1
LKPKIKQQQHYFDTIKELIKLNPANLNILIQLTFLNEISTQQQHQMQHQYLATSQQQQQHHQSNISRNQHNLNILHAAFSVSSQQTSTIFAQLMVRIILQRNVDDNLRILRVLLRDTIRHCRVDFDPICFTSELTSDTQIKQLFYTNQQTRGNLIAKTSSIFSIAGGLAEFQSIAVREKYVQAICDLVTVCILVSITPAIKEAYQRRHNDTKEILIKYYMIMSQIQCDTVTWLQSITRLYEITPKQLSKSLFHLLFMVDTPEQSYTIDNWPLEQDRGIMFRVVSEIPVLSELLHQILMIANILPELCLLMLRVEENLLKTAALVHIKDIYSLKLDKTDQFVQFLLNTSLYKYQNYQSVFAVNVLYWQSWQILLILTALDPKGFGSIAWQQYPTLRILMEMIMTDDYNFPPQSSVTHQMTAERYRAIEQQSIATERSEILDFENYFELKQGSTATRNETNSKLIGFLMKFDPTGVARQANNDVIQNIKKLNSEYKLGQLLCKCREPDLLLSLIERQDSKQSLPWLSNLIESNSNDCLDIMPIQCICEFVWNVLSSSSEEIVLKKQINIEHLLQRIKIILTSAVTSPQQVKDTLDYFLFKLTSNEQNVRIDSLKIMNKLFLSNNVSLIDKSLPQNKVLASQTIDVEKLLNVFKGLASFETCLKDLLIKYLRLSLMVEINQEYINLYLNFLFEQLLNDYKQRSELEASLVQGHIVNSQSLITFKSIYNDVGLDFSKFFFVRQQEYLSSHLITDDNQNDKYFCRFARLLLVINEYKLEDEIDGTKSSNTIKTIIKNKQPFDRANLDNNRYLLFESCRLLTDKNQSYFYIREEIFNLIIYLLLLIIENKLLKLSSDCESEVRMDTSTQNGEKGDLEDSNSDDFFFNKLIQMLFTVSPPLDNSDKEQLTLIKCLNSNFKNALNDFVIKKILCLKKETKSTTTMPTTSIPCYEVT